MGMLDWFKSIVTGDKAASGQAPAAIAAAGGEDAGAELAGLTH